MRLEYDVRGQDSTVPWVSADAVLWDRMMLIERGGASDHDQLVLKPHAKGAKDAKQESSL